MVEIGQSGRDRVGHDVHTSWVSLLLLIVFAVFVLRAIDSNDGSRSIISSAGSIGEQNEGGASSAEQVLEMAPANEQSVEIRNAAKNFKTAIEGALLDATNSDADSASESTGGRIGASGYVPQSAPAAYEGIPDPTDVIGFDPWGSFPIDQTVTGSRRQESLACTGTAEKPCVIDASGADFTKLTLAGSYVILQGGVVNAPAGSGSWLNSKECVNCVIRDFEVAGPGVDSGHASAVGLGSRNVWIRGSVHGFGDNRPDAREQDFHGFKLLKTDVWIFDAEIYDVSGDSVQVGDASRGSGERVYLGGGHYHHNRENGVDIKDSRDVVVSGVLMDGFRPTNSSPGEAIIIHDDAYDAKIFNNVIRDSTMGIVSSGYEGHIIQRNDIEAIRVGIQIRNTKNINVTDNLISAPTPIEVQSGGVSGTIQPE